VLSAAKLDTGALRSSQAVGGLASLASALVPYNRLKSTRRSTRV